MRRTTAFAYSIVAALVFLGPLLLFLAGMRSDPKFENRRLAPAPDLEITRLLDTAMYQEATAFFVDRVPLRDLGVRVDAWIDFHVLGDTPNPKDVAIGKDGWLFNPVTYTATCTDDLPDPELIVANADLLMSVLAESGRDVAFTISPQKRTIHPEYLGGLKEQAACAEEHSTALHDALLADPPTGYVDTWGILLQASAEGEIVYFRDDGHWNFVGAARSAAAIVEQLWPGAWSEEDVVVGEDSERAGNLALQMGLTSTETITPVWVEREGVTVLASKTQAAKQTPAVRIYRLELAQGATAPGVSTLALGDSFMGFTAEEHLAPYTESLVWINWRTIGRSGSLSNPAGRPVLKAEEFLLDTLAGADSVIVQTVEWEVWQRLSSMRLTYLLLASLSEDLPHQDIAERGTVVELPADVSSGSGRPFLVVRTDGEGTLDVRLLHRDGPGVKRTEIGRGEAPRSDLAVVDLRDLPTTGESAIRIRGVDPSQIELIRIVRV
ncbi:MAG: hypothetical protein KKE89_06685 [Actinobacteria bacterium]|nr:hypothetical protein [Actinomycetota bacterium]